MTLKIEKDSVSEEAVKPTASSRDKFLKKKRRVDTKAITLNGEEVELVIEALPTPELNELQVGHPKRKNNTDDNALGLNSKTFPPALFARSVREPKLSEDEWADIWTSPDWSAGELGHLLDLVFGTSTKGFDIPFGGSG